MPKVCCVVCDQYFDRSAIYRKIGLGSVCSPECFRGYRTHTEAKTKEHRRKVSKRKSEGTISPEMRLQVMVRDHYRCRYCGTHADLHVHHVVYRSQGGPGENWNLIVLCGEHHALVHSNKRKYMPLLRGVIWLTYMRQMRTTVPQLERWIDHDKWQTAS